MSDRIHTRIDPEIKQEVAQIFSRLGLSESDAIRMFYYQVQQHQGLPFEVKIPNAQTIAALHEDLSQAKRYTSFEEIRNDLDI
ncbi:MAG: type II toxin-antitoxin system RelB/DinJ family antitoxin [Chloroflexota bacterium]